MGGVPPPEDDVVEYNVKSESEPTSSRLLALASASVTLASKVRFSGGEDT